MSPVIRRAIPSDHRLLLGLIERYYASDGHRFDIGTVSGALDLLLRDASLGFVWLVESGGVAVGYAVVAFGFSLEFGGRDAFLDEIFLEAGHRGRGLGSKAMDLIEEECRNSGVKALHLETVGTNQRARRLYLARGYVEHDLPMLTKRLETR